MLNLNKLKLHLPVHHLYLTSFALGESIIFSRKVMNLNRMTFKFDLSSTHVNNASTVVISGWCAAISRSRRREVFRITLIAVTVVWYDLTLRLTGRRWESSFCWLPASAVDLRLDHCQWTIHLKSRKVARFSCKLTSDNMYPSCWVHSCVHNFSHLLALTSPVRIQPQINQHVPIQNSLIQILKI